MTSDNSSILFYRVSEAYGFMSNFARYPIALDGQVWPTSEHYFQAQKFAVEPTKEQVRAAPSPGEAARLGRTLPGIRSDWETIRDDVMLKALRAKFAQHADLGRLLVGTGGQRLIEHTPNDNYWADGGDGSGRNRLGELLMQVRDELREG